MGTLGRVTYQLFPGYSFILPYISHIYIYIRYMVVYMVGVLSQGYPPFPFDSSYGTPCQKIELSNLEFHGFITQICLKLSTRKTKYYVLYVYIYNICIYMIYQMYGYVCLDALSLHSSYLYTYAYKMVLIIIYSI